MENKYWNEMMKALEKDGEKLKDLTEEDHGPYSHWSDTRHKKTKDMWLSFPRELILKENEKVQIINWSYKHNLECSILKKAEEEVDRLGLIDILELPDLPFGPIGGGRTFSLTATSIGTIITVKCPCGEEFVVDNNL